MPAILNASACPAIPMPTSFLRLVDAENSPSAAHLVARTFTTGDTTTVAPDLNRNGLAQDLEGRYGGGGYAVCQNDLPTSLALVAPGSGLILTVKKGHAVIDGIVEVAADAPVTILDNTARSWIWLSQAGVLS